MLQSECHIGVTAADALHKIQQLQRTRVASLAPLSEKFLCFVLNASVMLAEDGGVVGVEIRMICTRVENGRLHMTCHFQRNRVANLAALW